MKCVDVSDNLFRYSEGAAGQLLSIRISRHIACCDACRKELEQLYESRRRLTEALQELVQTPDLSNAVMSRISAAHAPVPAGFHWRPVAALAAVALVAAIVLVSSHLNLRRENVMVKAPEAVHQQTAPPPEIVREPDAPREERIEVASEPQKRKVSGAKTVSAKKAPRQRLAKHVVQPKQERVDETQPVMAEEHAPVADSQIIVVVLPPQQSEASFLEIEVVNEETNTVSYYSQTTDDAGSVQVARMEYIRSNAFTEEERLEL